uniref:Uncharacterized protein n=1 Tax=Chromera velia CCMP2878 TaxID=1169474 RepID=A0A0G4GW26_9ALVE|eukprot:Cvel_5302.t1-p1 / transcript=Cvel_5302.t1 / gene=Cvel_5302 / organism=Chromera_velia_CCMP2878 / gene_product=Phosphatidylinositol 4-phosphate 5-kinase 5, putative / transcript_product=Phosphatidylinositol 4-phosphate 5-kinase 5, putative / location=Cvel_scaffold245:71659-74057(+) / protein_length=246 / sequence_SO=supercontig / SO=protein_coding / is_pseudo=false
MRGPILSGRHAVSEDKDIRVIAGAQELLRIGDVWTKKARRRTKKTREWRRIQTRYSPSRSHAGRTATTKIRKAGAEESEVFRGVLPPGAFGGGTGTGGPSPMGAAPNGTGSRTPPSVGMHVRASLVVRTGSFGPQKVLKLNKGTYRGHTWMGKPLGPGSLYYPSSVVFLGEFESSGRLLGVYTYPNGHILRGSFRPWTNTLEVTQQTMVYQNGTLYRGTIIGGEISGKGTARYSDGSIYKGRFRKV